MNDDLLTRLHEEPRAEFAEALYRRISRQPQSGFAGVIAPRFTLRNSLIALAFLFLVAACVHAVTDRGWHKVGNIWVDVETAYKVETFAQPETAGPVEQPQCPTVEEAKKVLRFELKQPVWAPEGFTLLNRICGVNQLSDFAYTYWEGTPKDAGIQLIASNLKMFNMAMQKYEIQSPFLSQPVAPGSYRKVVVHGQPAVLVRGDWDVPPPPADIPPGQSVVLDAKWDKNMALQLYWVDGETLYSLYTRAPVPVKDLIRMAESAQ